MMTDPHVWSDGPNQQPWLDRYPAGVPFRLDYPNEPLDWLLSHAATTVPDRTLCHFYGESLRYDEAYAQARALAATLQENGIEPGDRIGVLLPNLPETIVSLFGIWAAGGVAVSLSPLMVAEEVASLVKNTQCKAVITLDVLSPLICHDDCPVNLVLMTTLTGRLAFWERIGLSWIRFMRLGFSSPCPNRRVLAWNDVVHGKREYRERPKFSRDELAYILPTGGTTASPKAVMLSHGNLMANAWQLKSWTGGRHGEETILAVLPFFHSYGLSTCLTNGVAIGATLILHHRFRPTAAVQLIEEHRPTLFPAVPAMLRAMNTQVLRHGHHDLSSLRSCISGGAALPVSVADEFRQHSGCQLVEGYGLSEASPVTHAGPLDGTAVAGTIGLPLPDTQARIVDVATGTETLPLGEVGELAIRGPQVMLGYWNNPEETARVLRDGWLFTGDLGTCDHNGLFRIVDRKKDLIITSGFNVYPGDVEEVLRGYEGIEDAAVVGVPDDDRGELVKAILVTKNPGNFHRHQFDEFCRKHLAAHKRPRVVEVTAEDLPRNFLGKVLRRNLRESLDLTKTPRSTAAADESHE